MMKSLRRYQIPNADYFITVVTHNRRPILLDHSHLFQESWRNQELIGWVVLPDHFHVIINVRDSSISDIMHRFKMTYARRYRDTNGPGRIWQNRFWDHVIRDLADMNRHLDYIHYNAVKHGLVDSPLDYEHSSFHAWFERGHYERNWGSVEPDGLEGEFGE